MNNVVPRNWRGLTGLPCDTRESLAIKRDLPNYQYQAVRDAQLYLDARVVEKAGDDVLMRYKDRTFLIDIKGQRRRQE